MYSEGLWVYQNQFTGNRGQRAYGLLLQSVDESRIIENRLSANTIGIYLENSNHILLRGNEVDRNYVGVRLGSSSANNQFTANLFGANLHPIETTGNGGNNRWAVDGVGNFWESAKVIDFNGDGIGEFPHRELDLLGPYRRQFPAATLLSGSPAARLLQWSHRHAAWPGINGIKDPAPLNRPQGKSNAPSALSALTVLNP
jgi:nitrous oxidase accessory protein